MSVVLRLEGLSIECDRVEDAVRIARVLSQRDRITVTGRATEEMRLVRDVGFLRAVEQAGPSGISTDRIVEAVPLASGRAIGGITGSLRRRLERAGFSLDEVVARRRTHAGAVWVARDRLREAIDALGA